VVTERHQNILNHLLIRVWLACFVSASVWFTNPRGFNITIN